MKTLAVWTQPLQVLPRALYQAGTKVLFPFRFDIFMSDYTNVTYVFHMCDNRNPKNSMKMVLKSL